MPSTGTSARVMLAWLGHPLTLIALAVLIVNDHVLKSAWPGVVTGKLSDFAGLLVAPPLLAMALALCLPRLTPRSVALGASALVGIGFAFVKSTALGSVAASAAWSVVAGPSLIRADLTDLIALPAILAAYAVWRRASARPVSSRSVRVFRMGVVLPVALLGVIATSPAQYPTAYSVSIDEHDRIVIDELVSDDGARTFHKRTMDPSSPPSGRGKKKDCVDSLCYRVVPDHLKVERSDDGGSTWATAWEISDRARVVLAREYPDMYEANIGGQLSSLALVVQERPGGNHVVVVANGRDGYLVRDVEGVWTRIGFPDGSPAPAVYPSALPVGRWFDNLPLQMLFAFVLVVCLLAVGAAGAQLRDRRWGLGVSTLILTVGGLAVASATWPALFGDKGLVWPVLLLLSLGLAAVVSPLAYIGLSHEIYQPGSKRWLVLLSVAFGIVASLPFMAWTGAAIVDASVALWVTLTILILGAIVVFLQGFRASASPASVPDGAHPGR